MRDLDDDDDLRDGDLHDPDLGDDKDDLGGVIEALVATVRKDHLAIHRLASDLHCGTPDRERCAARACACIARSEPALLQPALHRLLRVAAAAEDEATRRALADALPRLVLTSGEAGRLAFVFEAWLEGSAPPLQRTAMNAMVALVPQRPALARRIRSVIEARAALGSPTAARHGRALLQTLKEF